MNVRFTGPAFAQLEAILSYLATKNPSVVGPFAARVGEILDHLSKFPKAFEEIENRSGVRRIPLQRYPYLIFYRVMPGEVVIVAIVHAARKEPWENL